MRCLLLMSIFVAAGCQATKPITGCEISATVINPNLDGCGLLLELTTGEKLMPANGSDFALEEGHRVKLDYQILEDQMSICMAEDHIVRITCLDILEDLPRKKPCLNISDPNEAGWMQGVLNDFQPTIIEKYNYLDGFAYQCKRSGMIRLYDCQGTLLCEFEEVDQSSCRLKRNNLKNKVEIWVAHR